MFEYHHAKDMTDNSAREEYLRLMTRMRSRLADAIGVSIHFLILIVVLRPFHLGLSRITRECCPTVPALYYRRAARDRVRNALRVDR